MTPRMMHPREWKKRWNLPQFDEMEDDEMTAMDDIMQVRCRAVIHRHLGTVADLPNFYGWGFN